MNICSDTDFTTSSLRHWIQPQHLKSVAIAFMAERLASRPAQYVVVDNFMDIKRLTRIKDTILSDGIMRTTHRFYDLAEEVSQEQFETAPDVRRLSYQTKYSGPRDEKKMSFAALEDLRLRNQLTTMVFYHWLSTITGQIIDHLEGIQLKGLRKEHYLRWHHDANKTRTVIIILYVSDDWRPEYGGRLLFRDHDGTIEAIEPLFNRLVIFNTNTKMLHRIEPMTEHAGNWTRLAYGVPFGYSVP